MKHYARLFCPLSKVYGLLVKLDNVFTISRALPKPVISIGNITWGGSGKTPVVINLAKQLVSKGLKPAILSRGYKRENSNTKCLIVSDGKQILESAEIAGDEPYLIAQKVPGAAVIVGADKFVCGSLALEKVKPDVFILDDGFQHWKLKRNLDIVCINAQNPFGNGCLIPAGILREPLGSLKRAGLIILTNSDLAEEKALIDIERKISQYNENMPLRAINKIIGLRELSSNKNKNISEFQNKKIIALSAIAGNERFKKTLEQNKINVVEHFTFRDHHWYNLDEMKSIFLRVDKDCPVITTSKDAVRLASLINVLEKEDAQRIFVLDTEIEFVKGEDVWEQNIRKALRYS